VQALVQKLVGDLAGALARGGAADTWAVEEFVKAAAAVPKEASVAVPKETSVAVLAEVPRLRELLTINYNNGEAPASSVKCLPAPARLLLRR
jgi:hypothetical protein